MSVTTLTQVLQHRMHFKKFNPWRYSNSKSDCFYASGGILMIVNKIIENKTIYVSWNGKWKIPQLSWQSVRLTRARSRDRAPAESIIFSLIVFVWFDSSVGRASALHAEGPGIVARSDQIVFFFFLLLFPLFFLPLGYYVFCCFSGKKIDNQTRIKFPFVFLHSHTLLDSRR